MYIRTCLLISWLRYLHLSYTVSRRTRSWTTRPSSTRSSPVWPQPMLSSLFPRCWRIGIWESTLRSWRATSKICQRYALYCFLLKKKSKWNKSYEFKMYLKWILNLMIWCSGIISCLACLKFKWIFLSVHLPVCNLSHFDFLLTLEPNFSHFAVQKNFQWNIVNWIHFVQMKVHVSLQREIGKWNSKKIAGELQHLWIFSLLLAYTFSINALNALWSFI